MIKINHLTKEYTDITPLKDVNIEIHKGDVISIIGPSGTGKSTLIRCINMLDQPTSGQIFVDGEEITAKGCDVARIRRKMGMVFQHFNLFPHMTVLQNLTCAPLMLNKCTKTEAEEKAMELLNRIGLADKADVYPSTLSGGQKQRVAIARAFVHDPKLIVADEPTSDLDEENTKIILDYFTSQAKNGKAILISTHDLSFINGEMIHYVMKKGVMERI